MNKAVFSASILQSSVSHDLQKSSAAQKTFLIIINVENSCAASYFNGNPDIFFQYSLNRKFKEHNLLYLKYKYFVKSQIYVPSPLIHLMYPTIVRSLFQSELIV